MAQAKAMKSLVTMLVLFSVLAPAGTVNVPANGNIQEAVDANPPNTVFQLEPGSYRMQTVFPKDGDQFLGSLDGVGNRLTIMTGAQPLTAFRRDEFGDY